MHTTGTIVVGVDGSNASARALSWAVQQAQAERRPLMLVHTINAVTPAFLDAAIVDARDAGSVLDAAGRAVLADARHEVERTAPDLEVHEVFDLADPRDRLLELAGDASMIVVGSRGRGSARSLLLGSVSVALVRHAHCPVVVVRPGHVGTVRNGVLVGVDTEPESLPVLELAFRQASLHDLPLTVLHTPWDLRGGTEAESDRLALAETTAGMGEKYPEVHVTTRMASGAPEAVLTDASDRMDLVVVGAHQKGRFSRAFFGSVSVYVVEHATCPVAVVPLSTSS
jgi:nucleotide-binding universal stress UspA family protein